MDERNEAFRNTETNAAGTGHIENHDTDSSRAEVGHMESGYAGAAGGHAGSSYAESGGIGAENACAGAAGGHADSSYAESGGIGAENACAGAAGGHTDSSYAESGRMGMESGHAGTSQAASQGSQSGGAYGGAFSGGSGSREGSAGGGTNYGGSGGGGTGSYGIQGQQPDFQSYRNYQEGPASGGPGKKKKGGKGLAVAGIVAASVLGLGVLGFGFWQVNRIVDGLKNVVETYQTDDAAGQPDKKAGEEVQVSEAGQSTTSKIATTETTDGSDLSGRDVSAIVENVMPSIVSIQCSVSESQYVFGQYYGDKEYESSGSGVILDESGEELLLVTNYHVVEDASSIMVTFFDEKQVQAAVKGADIDSDLAVLSVQKSELGEDTASKIRTIAVGNSDSMQVGEMAIAIGNALGYGQSVTVGYVSAKDRTVTVDSRKSRNLIQTDAAINPGNSGGALLNDRGELIGINSIKFTNTAVEGVGYAIAITDASTIIDELMHTETLAAEEKGYLGVSCADVTTALSEQYNMPQGVFLSEVAEGGAAEEAGLMKGDIITAVNGTEVQTMEGLQQRIQNKRVGTEVAVTFERYENGSYKEKEVKVCLKGKESLDALEKQAEEEQKQQEQQQQQQTPSIEQFFDDFFLPY